MGDKRVTFRPAGWLRNNHATILLCTLTLGYSLFVALHVTGNPMGTVKVTQLLAYGGTSFERLADLEFWRLATAQLVHVKQLHMLLNLAGLLLLGSLLEARLGAGRLLVIWFFAGGIATAISPWGIEAPWNIGAGASQATFAYATAALAIAIVERQASRWLQGLAAFVLIPGLLLDITAVGYPKLGHAVAMLLGAAFGFMFASRARRGPGQQLSATRP
jgi:rhomboid protease GluP